MIIDMHVHTNRYSSCSVIDPIDLVHQASNLRLSGIVIVEHYHMWSQEEIEELKRKTNNELLILRGQEVICSVGHLLVFGYYGELDENSATEEIVNKVHAVGGIVIMAHPFRNGNSLGENPQTLQDRFSCVDGIEVFNANQNRAENEYGRRVWQTLGIAGIGGSDAHSAEMVGRYLTRFENVIKDEDDLIAEIKGGRCEPMVYDAKARFRRRQLTGAKTPRVNIIHPNCLRQIRLP